MKTHSACGVWFLFLLSLSWCVGGAAPVLAQSAPGTQGPLMPAPHPELAQRIEQRAQAIEERLIAWRRDIHQHPELGNQEVRTSQWLADHLRALGLEVKTGVAGTGVVGLLKGGQPGPVVALRADMDALPVKEQVNVPFASRAKGVYLGKEVDAMHACGHDAHTAILMATAEVLSSVKEGLPGSVKFIFQPAEEGPADFEPDGKRTWGAKMMIQEGVMDHPKVDAIFGLHVTSALHTGQLKWRGGPTMASADQFWIEVTGRQAHGARPWSGVDPIVLGSQIVMGLQTIVSRQLNIMHEPAVVTVGTMHSGNRFNILPDNLSMTGTIRTYDAAMQKDIHQRLTRTAESIAQAAGAKAEVRVVEIYGPTVNDWTLTETMGATLRRVAGEGQYGLLTKSSASEDFSFYQAQAPGMFFYLGVTPKGADLEKTPSNHSPHFFVDESSLITGVRALSNLAVDYLVQGHQKQKM